MRAELVIKTALEDHAVKVEVTRRDEAVKDTDAGISFV